MLNKRIFPVAIASLSLITITFSQTFAEANNKAHYAKDYAVQNSEISIIKPLGYDDDVIYNYEEKFYQSHGNFARVIPGYEIVRNGLRYRGTLYLVETRSSGSNSWYGIYRGDLYFVGNAR